MRVDTGNYLTKSAICVLFMKMSTPKQKPVYTGFCLLGVSGSTEVVPFIRIFNKEFPVDS